MKLSPIDCDTEEKLAMIRNGTKTAGKKWTILTDSYEISFYEEYGNQSICIPKKHFDSLVKWYLEKQECDTTKSTEGGKG